MKKKLLIIAISLVCLAGGCGVNSEAKAEEELEEELENVKSDKYKCDSVQTAVVTALTDPEINDWSGYDSTFKSWLNETKISSLSKDNKLSEGVLEVLGAENGSEVNSSLKSYGAEEIYFQVIDACTVSVWIPGTDASGSKGKNPETSSMINTN